MTTVVAGLDVSYVAGSDRVAAAEVAVDLRDGRVVEEVVVHGEATVAYEPGRLADREAPVLLSALAALVARHPVDVLLCDGQGIAHPRRHGLACVVGAAAGLPAIGCAKTWLVGGHDPPGPRRGDRSPLIDRGDLVGYALRTQDGARPVYVSPGHDIGPDEACEVVLAACSRFRLPDPVRHADRISRAALRG